MRVLRFLPAVTLLFACAAAHADSMPHRKPGLWNITMTMQGMNMPATTMQMCIDAATDAAMMNMHRGQESCGKPTPHTAGDVTTMDFQCMMGSSRATTHIVFTRQGDEAYKMDSHTHFDPPMHGMTDSAAVQDAIWLGPCKPGMVPGDMVMPGGMKINMLHGGMPPH